jgi:hypothetical protein
MASAGDADVRVEHEAGARRFVAREGRELVGYLAYEPAGAGVLDLQHTVVLPEARGQGIGEALVRAALAHAREAGAHVIPTCRFVAAHLESHPEDRDLVAAEADAG